MANLRLRLRGSGGALSVDFALVVVPVLFLILALFEICTTLLAQNTLDRAVSAAARGLADGTLAASGTASALRTRICGAFVLIPQSACEAHLRVDLRALTSDAAVPSAVAGGAINDAAFGDAPAAAADDVILVRAALPLPPLTPFSLNWWPRVADGEGTVHLLIATAAVRRDPYAAYQSAGAP
ncbi:TadE/TadG family type IV pilus assembly protein [Aquabacter spiritensis]|uniref:TadE-like protein n=1 Tax=Aquabacter spiritensis TaxID=933073 RepID=A0A4R3M2S3_9HYPH|nr:TadE family protein [Aquabacter spiritensis]TCT07504.1 TadE-like protein [Aquabacter spiritensis]